MNKKGFTLVELLAVIAILGVIVIVATPTVLKMYNQSKKESFSNSVNGIIKAARQKFIADGAKEQEYTSVDVYGNKLDLTGGKNLQYYVHMDGNGNIVEIQVTDGEFQYSDSGNIESVPSNEVDEISELSDPQIIEVTGDSNYKTYKYVRNGSPATVGRSFICGDSPISSPRSNWDYFIRVVMNGTIIEEAKLGFKYNGKYYYLNGANDTSLYDKNKKIIKNIFGEANCTEISSGYKCTTTGLSVYAYTSGNVKASDGSFYCSLHGGFYCISWDEGPHFC